MPSRIPAQPPSPQKRYRAFISYSRKDEVWARRIHAALEAYRAPRGVGAHVDHRTGHLGRIFRDDDEMPATQSLGASIETALAATETLIVICSPHSAQSAWVDTEVRRFRTHPNARVLAVIVAGAPNAVDPREECFCPGLRWRVGSDGCLSDIPDEPMAPDVRREGFDRLVTRLAAGILDVSFDVLWRRQVRRTRRRWQMAGILAVAMGCAIVAAATVAGTTAKRDLASAVLNIATTKLELARAAGDVTAMEGVLRLATFAAVEDTHRTAARDLMIETIAATRTQWRTTLPDGPAPNIAFSQDGKVVFALSKKGRVTLFNALSGAEVYRLELGGAPIGMSETGSHILIAGPDGPMLWRSDNWTAKPLAGGAPTCADFNPRTGTVITCHRDGGAQLWNVSTGTLIQNITQDGPPWTSARFDKRGERILFSSEYGAWFIWDVESGTPEATLLHAGRRFDWQKVGIYNYFASGLSAAPFGALRTPTGVIPISGHNAPLTAARLFGDEAEHLQIASGDATGRLVISMVAQPVTRMNANLKGHSGAITALAVSPDRTQIATAGADGGLRVWSLEHIAESLRATIANGTDPVTAICGSKGYFLTRAARKITPADASALPALSASVGADVCALASDHLAD